MFYVYKYLRDDGTPYYIGKGTGNRAWYKGKNENINLPVDSSNILIIEENLTEEAAHQLEIKLIAQYGRKDIGTGILRNLTDGGEGTTGAKFGPVPEDRRQKISKKLTGRKLSEDTKKKLSIAHTGLKQSAETKKKRSEKLQGITRSECTKQRMSESKLGDKNPMFGKASPNKGKKMSDEQKEKIRQSVLATARQKRKK